METNRSIEKSRRIYAGLLNLYPREHHTEYGADMLQLFTDQCRSAKNRRGMAALWLRTLIDLGISVIREQLSSPYRTLGLLEAPPNAPLPWKGVALVLLPGLIFFISQVAQVSGEDWFFLLVYRGAFFLIFPVLLVWVLARKFPIWGLIPLGLLARTVITYGNKAQYVWMDWQVKVREAVGPTLISLNRAWDLPWVPVDKMRTIVMTGLALLCLALIFWIIRRAVFPRRAWAWLGSYILVVAASLGMQVWHIMIVNDPSNTPGLNYPALLNDYSYTYLLTYGGFLALILSGALLARRHGQLAALLPLGFLLPTVLFGRMMDEWPAATSPDFTIMLLVSAGALIYRFLVAVAGPLWIVRSATGQRQKRSSAVSLILLVVLQAACNVAMMFYYYGYVRMASSLYLAISDQLIMAAGIALALSLYRPQPAGPKLQADLQTAQVLEQ